MTTQGTAPAAASRETEIRDVRMPDLGEGLTEATVVRWLVAVGDEIAEDQVVAEVETAKATVELPTPVGGTVRELRAAEGEEVDVGSVVLTVAPAGVADGHADDGHADAGGDDADHAAGSAAAGDPSAGEATPADPGRPPDATAGDGGGADDDEGHSVLVGYGTGGGRGRRRRRARARHTAPPARTASPRAKPPVRKLAKDLGVDLATVTGSGPEGRITRNDVRSAADGAVGASEPGGTDDRAATTTARARAADHVARAPAPQRSATREPVTGIRARIADHLSVAWQEIPAASCWVDCDATALLALRDELVAAHPQVRLTPLAVVLRCVTVALGQVPQLNASFDADARELVHHDRVDLGVATQTDRGLLVPVLRDAAGRSIPELAAEVERLASGARDGVLAPAELVGSTFTVSNVGAFGVDGGIPIVNHPEAGILGVGRIAPRPWVVDEAVVARPVVTLTLSFDHRVCDGLEAAGFLRAVADLVERPTLLLGH